MVVTLIGAGATAAPAQAVHWPFFGGDSGRSGLQPVDEGGAPLSFLYAKSGVGEGTVKTSIVTSSGSPSAARLAWGTTAGRIHLQELATGAPVPADGEAGTDVTGIGAVEPFGAPGRQSVTPADTSTAAGPGQLFVVHNEATTIEVAQFDLPSGARIDQNADVDGLQDREVAGSSGFRAFSSVVATAPDATGARELFFLARSISGVDEPRLYRVPISGDARLASARVDGAGASFVEVAGAAIDASPALVVLRNGAGVPTAHMAVGTSTGVKTYEATLSMSPGPESGPLGGTALTPSAPVQPTGVTPSPAPVLYVPVDAGSTTIVKKLLPGSGTLADSGATSATLAGESAPALAVTQKATSASPPEGRLVVTTGANLYLLRTTDLTTVDQLVADDAPLTFPNGFSQTTAAASGDLLYVTRDNGTPLALTVADLAPVTLPDTGIVTAPAFGVGQPSISRGFVQYGNSNGVLVFRNTDLLDPSVTLTVPGSSSGPAAVTATAGDERGIAKVQFLVDGAVVATDENADSGSPFSRPGATYSAVIDLSKLSNGTHTLTAVATDASGRTATSAPVTVTVQNGSATPGATQGADQPPTVSWIAPASRALLRGPVELQVAVADDRGVAGIKVEDGGRFVCFDTAAPYGCTYTPRGDDVGENTLTVTAVDSAAQVARASRVVLVSRFTPRLTAGTTPRRDRKAPYRFRTRGRVALPSGVTRGQACGKGRVAIQIKAQKRTISTRRTTLAANCTFSSQVTFRLPRRVRPGALQVSARFLGNDVLLPRSAPRHTVSAR